VLVNSEARKQVIGMHVDEDEFDIETDHRMLVLEYNWSGKEQTQKTTRVKENWCMRTANWNDFSDKLKKVEWMRNGNVNDWNSKITNTLYDVAEQTIGRMRCKNNNKRHKWFTREIKEERLKRKTLNKKQRKMRKLFEQQRITDIEWQNVWDEYRCQQKKVKRLIYEARVTDERIQIDKLKEKGPDGIKDWYKFIQGNNRCKEVNVHEFLVNGHTVSERLQMVKAVEEFWEDIGGMNEQGIAVNVVNLQISEYDLQIEGEITCEEIESFLKKVKNGKASGPDSIPYEFYKHGGMSIVRMLKCLFDEIWKSERVPDVWNKCNVVLVHKGGNKSMKELKNYRPIALADTVCKIFCGILNERMKQVVEDHGVMGEEQNGFRRDRRGEDNLFVVNEIIERMKKEGKKVYLAFLDIEKAYDRVDRLRLFDILRKVGFSRKIVNIVKSLYENTSAKYRLGDLETEQVRSIRGVRQGCTLSPLLFGLYTEELAVRMRKSGLGLNVDGERLSSLLYADDIVAVSESWQELQVMLDIVNGYGRDFNVKFSGDKSKVMVVNGDELDKERKWNIGDVVIERKKNIST
jgi:hypothetical protein